MDGVKVALGSSSMMLEAARQCVKDRKEWRGLMHVQMIKFNAAIFARPCVLSDRPPALGWIVTWRGVGCRYLMRLR